MLIDKLVLECEYEVLNAILLNEISLNTIDTISVACKKVPRKINYTICIISLAIMSLILLAIVSVSCYYYCTRYWLKKEYLMSLY